MVAEFVRKRRFGASDTMAGNRKVFFASAAFGSGVMVTDDSEADRDVDVSYPFLYWLRNFGTLRGQIQGRAVPDFD